MQAHAAPAGRAPLSGFHYSEHIRSDTDAYLWITEMASCVVGVKKGALRVAVVTSLTGPVGKQPARHAGHQAAETKCDTCLIPLCQPATSHLIAHASVADAGV